MLPAGLGSPIVKTLQDIIDSARKIKEKTKSYDKIFEKTFPNMNAFKTICNDMIMLNEQLHFYGYFWHKIQKRKNLSFDDVKKIDRVLTWTYIHSFSVVEYTTKELIKQTNIEHFCQIKHKLNEGNWVKFHKIIKKSNPLLLDDQQESVWAILREIRNAIVHNNAFFTKDNQADYTFEDQIFKLQCKRNEYLQGDLDFMLTLIEILIELYYKWVNNFLY